MALGKRQRAVSSHQKQQAHKREMQVLSGAVANRLPADHAICQHDRARDREPHATHQWGRDLFDGNVDAEIRRSPKQIHQPKIEGQHETGWRSRRHASKAFLTFKVLDDGCGRVDSESFRIRLYTGRWTQRWKVGHGSGIAHRSTARCLTRSKLSISPPLTSFP